MKQNVKKLAFLALVSIWAACGQPTKEKNSSSQNLESILPNKASFIDTIDNKPTQLFVLRNEGILAAITNYGGRLVSLVVNDKTGKPTDVVIGMSAPNAYANASEPYFGALIGRVGNRIAKGHFSLDNKSYTLFTNNGPNTLHGGKKGFQYVVWEGNQPNDSTLVLRYQSPDGEEGFPGKLDVKVTYTVTEHQGLEIAYEARTDKRTPVNLTNHAFFNLNGEGSGTINNHLLSINADAYTPVDSTLIPLGKNELVDSTPFDFRQLTAIGSRVDQENIQLKYGKGYDHNFVLNRKDASEYVHAAQAIGDQSGIVMDIYTKEPGLQFYGGNFMQSNNTLKNGTKDDFRTAFCLETQHFPDSPNQPNFPTIILSPGQVYSTSSAYIFSTE